MIVTKCDICGKEMPLNSSRYKVYFDGWLDKEDKDICVSCFERIKEEIMQANTPQMETKTEIQNSNSTFKFERTIAIDGDVVRYGEWEFTGQSERSE